MRTVLLVVFDGVQSLDVTGPLEVFAGATPGRTGGRAAPAGYDLRTASLGGNTVTTSSRLRLLPDQDLRDIGHAPDVLIVPGGEGTRQPDRACRVARAHGRQAGRLVSVCTGAFLLAEAGLLTGEAGDHPLGLLGPGRQVSDLDVEQDPIFVRDGTSPPRRRHRGDGPRAGPRGGRPWPRRGARGRQAPGRVPPPPGNQAQFSTQSAAQVANREPLREVQHWIADHPAADLSVRALARQASLSPRQFARAFAAEVGMPPGRYVDRIRLEAARRQLEDTTAGVEQTALFLRLRHARGDAPRLRPRPRHQPWGVPPPLPPRRYRQSTPRLRTAMQIAIVLYDRFTALDAIGPYQVLSALPGADVVFAAERPGPMGLVSDEEGRLIVSAEAALTDVPRPDIIVVPGGPGQRDQMADALLHAWLRDADQTSTWTTSVCTGSLILAAAGLLVGRRATSYWMAIDQLAKFGAAPVAERVVFDGKYVTAAGVSSGIDMALALAGRVAGDRVAQAIQLGIEYDPQPPYDAGSPDRAPADLVAALRSRSG